jgi:hypothetical protein
MYLPKFDSSAILKAKWQTRLQDSPTPVCVGLEPQIMKHKICEIQEIRYMIIYLIIIVGL